MHMALAILLLSLSSITVAATYEQLRRCADAMIDAEKITCLNALVEEAKPPRPGDAPKHPPASPNRFVVHGVLAPAFYDSGVDAFRVPATISLSRANNRSATDVNASAIYHRYFGENKNQGFFAGTGWFRKELGTSRTDARSLIVGTELIQGFESGERSSDWFALYTPSAIHRRDIYKKETTDIYALSASWGRFLPLGASADERNTFSIDAAIEASHLRPDSAPKRDALTASLGLKSTYGLTERLLLSAALSFYDYIDRPFGTNEGSDTYGQIALRWDLDPTKRGGFRPYVTIMRQFGAKPEDSTWIPNQTVLALGINFDSSDTREP